MTLQQLQRLDESSYLIFYPSMSSISKIRSYIYYANVSIRSGNYTIAYNLLDKAQAAIKEDEASISKFKGVAFIAMLIVTIIIALIEIRFLNLKYK